MKKKKKYNDNNMCVWSTCSFAKKYLKAISKLVSFITFTTEFQTVTIREMLNICVYD